MLKYFIAIFIFCLVLFLYLHIQYHLKTSEDLEVYTIERPSKETLEEICNIRQPVVFEFNNERLLESCNLATLDDNYGAFDIQLRDITNKDENGIRKCTCHCRHKARYISATNTISLKTYCLFCVIFFYIK